MCAALECLAADAVERGGRGEVAGAMVQELAGQRTGLRTVGGLHAGDACGGLYNAVEAAPVGPRPAMTPCAHEHDHESRMSLRELVLGQPEAIERAGPVAAHENICSI